MTRSLCGPWYVVPWHRVDHGRRVQVGKYMTYLAQLLTVLGIKVASPQTCHEFLKS